MKNEEMPNLKKEFTLGMSAFIVNSLLLLLGVYLCSLLYKAGARIAEQDARESLPYVITGSNLYYVNTAAGMAGVILLFALKNIYDLRFFAIQIHARNERQTAKRVLEWMLYVPIMALMTVWIFLAFNCGKDFVGKGFYDDYRFRSFALRNMKDTLLFVVMPLLYVIHALVRKILKKCGIEFGAKVAKTRAERRREAREAEKKHKGESK